MYIVWIDRSEPGEILRSFCQGFFGRVISAYLGVKTDQIGSQIGSKKALQNGSNHSYRLQL